MLIDPAPASNDAASQCQKEKWRIGHKMLAEKRNNLDRMKTKAVLETSPRTQMHQCDPGMLGIPHNGWNRAKSEYHH